MSMDLRGPGANSVFNILGGDIARATLSSNISISSDANTTVRFDNAALDPNSNLAGLGTGDFSYICPGDGLYAVALQLSWVAANNQNELYAAIAVVFPEGGGYFGQRSKAFGVATSSADVSAVAFFVDELEEDELITPFAFCENTDYDLRGGSNYEDTSFTVVRLTR